MKYKGIARGDGKFRHFTFEDDDMITRDGKQYYKVNYGKNPLEGEGAEDEIGYVLCDNVITLGGRKPKRKEVVQVAELNPTPEPVPEPTPIPEPEQVEKEVKKKKATRTKKTTTKSKKSEPVVNPVPESTSSIAKMYEYYVGEFKATSINELQEEFNKLGDQGWELCGFDTNKSLFGDIQFIAVFKRAK